jgi:5-methylcytosine-specific restriction protein A
MSRSLEEWRGKTDDAKVPPRVRARIFLREEGKCWISGRKIGPSDVWELDHKVALINGGAHAEHNLFPALKDKHREKTSEDVKLKSKTYRMAAKHNGSWPKSRAKIKTRGFQSSRPSAAAKDEADL